MAGEDIPPEFVDGVLEPLRGLVAGVARQRGLEAVETVEREDGEAVGGKQHVVLDDGVGEELAAEAVDGGTDGRVKKGRDVELVCGLGEDDSLDLLVPRRQVGGV